MLDRLDGMKWKLWRAEQHGQALYNATQAFFQTEFYRTRAEQDSEGRLVFFVTEVDPMPPEWGLMIGDTAHNLRSALDHLIFLLAKPVGEKEEKAVQFPLFDSPEKWDNAEGRNVPGVAPGVEALVESLQPYNSGKWPNTALLGQIQAIDNWDKHRALLTTATSSEIARLTTTISANANLVSEERFRGELKPGAILARIKLGNPVKGDKVSVHPEMTFIPIFDSSMPEPIRGRPVLDTLANAGQFIQGEVIPMFFHFVWPEHFVSIHRK